MPGLHVQGNVMGGNSDWTNIWDSIDCWLARSSRNRRCLRNGLKADIIVGMLRDPWPNNLEYYIIFPWSYVAWSILRVCQGLRTKEAWTNQNTVRKGSRWCIVWWNGGSLIKEDSTKRKLESMYLNIILFRYILLGKSLQDSYQPRVKMRAPGPCKRFFTLDQQKHIYLFCI